MAGLSARQTISRLHAIRNRYGAGVVREKAALLASIPDLTIRTTADLGKLHIALCFLRAFPDSARVHGAATRLLDDFPRLAGDLSDTQRSRLTDSGYAGSALHYQFSFEVGAWLARRFPGVAHIDWDEFGDTARFDELLAHLMHESEADYFDSGQVTTDEWVRLAASHGHDTDFDWLMSELDDRRHHSRFWTGLYNAAEVPLRCDLGDTGLSRTRNVYPAGAVSYRAESMANRVSRAKAGIARPLRSLKRLSPEAGAKLLDVAMASLAVRHRETIHFNYANPAEVWMADVGKGVQIAATGLLPEHRYPLECTMGFLILSNGVPIGYGGSSMVYRQANTGINIFDEYRGSEAAWLWVQVMRVFHAISGCTRFIANPYQFGEDNPEALASGAFWFYYRLGYRPVDSDVRRLALDEQAKIKARTGYRTPIATLKALATCDMHLTLPGARQSDYFDEAWIETCSLLATRELARTRHRSRRKALDDIAHRLAGDLGILRMEDWSAEERKWFVRMGPLVAATNPGGWTKREQASLIRLMRAKGADNERDFIRRFGRHERWFHELKNSCRRAARAG
jgi:hypothetical protein